MKMNEEIEELLKNKITRTIIERAIRESAQKRGICLKCMKEIEDESKTNKSE